MRITFKSAGILREKALQLARNDIHNNKSFIGSEHTTTEVEHFLREKVRVNNVYVLWFERGEKDILVVSVLRYDRMKSIRIVFKGGQIVRVYESMQFNQGYSTISGMASILNKMFDTVYLPYNRFYDKCGLRCIPDILTDYIYLYRQCKKAENHPSNV